ncbi:MAG: chemotaxis protein CheC [Anaerolineaceae bacterium]
MGDSSNEISEKLIEKLGALAGKGFANAALGFSQMIGEQLSVKSPEVSKVKLSSLYEILGGAENDAVGIYLRFEGNLKGQVMMVIPYQQAMGIADMLMERPNGTTTELGQMERSALAEVGNLTGSFFLNAIAEITGISSHPTPPAVMIDMVGSILDVVIATMGDIGDEVLMFRATFIRGDRSTKTDFWVLPDMITLQKLSSGKG